MKKILILLFLLVGFSFADVVAERYDDGEIHRALPSWIDLSDAETTSFAEGGTVLNLSDRNYISYMSKTYSSLTVFNDGRISFGDLTTDLDRDMESYLQPLSVPQNFGTSFRWKSIVDANSNYFTVIEMGPFQYRGKSYSVQSSFFIDGEIQVQLWQNDVAHAKPELQNWMLPVLFNGSVKNRPAKKQFSKMEVYGKNGLRPGWIAKSFDGYGVQISEPIGTGKGLQVQMGSSADAGGLLAGDYSREHPVVGGIRNVEVLLSSPIQSEDSLCIWYFNDFGKTYLANYPSLKKNQTFARFSPNDYTQQWNGPFYTSAYITRPAPAFKFQQAKAKNTGMQFTIQRILYNLKQLPSIQFLRPKPYRLTFSISGNGRVSMNTPLGNSPITLYEGEKASAAIIGKAGSSIRKISVNGKDVLTEGELVSKKSQTASIQTVRNESHYSSLFKAYGEKPYSKIDFDITAMNEDVNVVIEFAPCSSRVLAVIPEMQKTTSYLDAENLANGRKFASARFKDGFGTVVQTQDSLATGKYIVSAVYSDALGKSKYEPMAFVRDTTALGYMDMACEACVTAANNYYDGTDSTDRPNAENNAFTEFDPRYENKTGSFGRQAGIAKTSFEYQQQVPESYGLPASFAVDFLDTAYLSESGLSKAYSARLKNPGGKHLTVTRDAEGRYIQNITDEKGRTVSTWSFDGTSTLVSINEFDEYDRLIRTYLKDFPAFADTFHYDAKGRLLSKKSNDRGLVEYAYDSLGNLRFTRTARQKAMGSNYFTANVYDSEGRIIAIGEVRGGHSFSAPDIQIATAAFTPTVRTLFGKPLADTLALYGVNLDKELLENILSQMEGVRDYDVGAVIAYDSEGNPVSVKMNSYDRIGRKSKRWTIYLFDNVPALQLSYTYNLSDEPVASTYSEWDGNGWAQKSARTRTYDNRGRLVETRENGSLLAGYEYSANGNVIAKHYYDVGNEVFTKSVIRDVYGRPVTLNYKRGAVDLYSESISYESPLSARQSEVERVWNAAGSAGHLVENAGYAYDYLGRLTGMFGSRNASYRYDRLGRLTLKTEGQEVVGYDYKNAGFYRPSGMTISGRSYTPTDYYRYDASGNVWFDLYSRAVYELDSRALPEKVRLYREIPTGISQENLADFEPQERASVLMAYDENGQRLHYAFFGGGSESAEATFPGVGAYRREGADSAYFLDRADLVAGGFRRGGTAYFPVTDVQGNVRGYANTSGVQSAYAYYPYGALTDLAHDDAEDSKRWQGKEFDSDLNKYYFGARFYDPVFGLWLSPDPANQFADPYTYGGDPLNYIDPNGESVTAAIVVGAIVGAAIGASISAVNCSGANEVGCGRVMAQGAAMGAVAGAASGGVGSAVSGAIGGVGGAIAGGASGGATSGTINYLGNSVTGNGSVDGMGLWTAFWQGAFGGAVSGGVGAYMGNASWNLLGNRGAEIFASGLGSGIGSKLNGNSFWDGFAQGAVLGLASSVLTGLISPDFEYDGNNLGEAKLQKGDIVGWGPDGSVVSGGILAVTGEDFSHVGVVDEDAEGLFIREATGEGKQIRTELTVNKYQDRPYKVYGNRRIAQPYVEQKYGYNLVETNCTSQATRWTGMSYANNPGILYRRMNGITPFYRSSTWQGYHLW